MLSKEKEIFKNMNNKRFDKTDKLSKKIDYSSGLETDFSELKDPVAFRVEETRYKQEEFNRYLRK